MALKDIIGQERAINILKGCIARERVPHALLFAGDEGIGKRLAAVNFAKALNCLGSGGGDQGSAGMHFPVGNRSDVCVCWAGEVLPLGATG